MIIGGYLALIMWYSVKNNKFAVEKCYHTEMIKPDWIIQNSIPRVFVCIWIYINNGFNFYICSLV